MKHHADQPLVQLIVQGDEGAERIFEQTYRPRLLRFLRARDIALPDAEEIAQEALFAAFQEIRANHYRGKASLGTWLVGILKHKIGDYWRQHSRHEVPLVPLEELAELPGIEEKIFAQEALKALPHDLSGILLLHETEGLTLEEIATRLRIKLGKVWHKLRKAKELLWQQSCQTRVRTNQRKIFPWKPRLKILPSESDQDE